MYQDISTTKEQGAMNLHIYKGMRLWNCVNDFSHEAQEGDFVLTPSGLFILRADGHLWRQTNYNLMRIDGVLVPIRRSAALPELLSLVGGARKAESVDVPHVIRYRPATNEERAADFHQRQDAANDRSAQSLHDLRLGGAR